MKIGDMKIGDFLLHQPTLNTRKIKDIIINENSETLYITKCIKTGKEYIVRPNNIEVEYFSSQKIATDLLVQYNDFQIGSTYILQKNTKLFSDLKTIVGVYIVPSQKELNTDSATSITYYVDSDGIVLTRADFFLLTSLNTNDANFVFWEPEKKQAHEAYFSNDWIIQSRFENGALVMKKSGFPREILVIPGENCFRETDLNKIILPTMFEGENIIYNVYCDTGDVRDSKPTYEISGNKLVLYDINIPSNTNKRSVEKVIYMPNPPYGNGSARVFSKYYVQLHTQAFALFAASKLDKNDMLSTYKCKTTRTLASELWSNPDEERRGNYSNHFLEWITPCRLIIELPEFSGENRFNLAIGQTSTSFIINAKFDLVRTTGWLQKRISIGNYKVYTNPREEYEKYKINKNYRLSISKSDALEQIAFKAFTDKDGITYGITDDHRLINMKEVELF